MISRRNGFELGVALSLASVCVTFELPALAEDATAPATSADAPPPPPAEAAPAASADAEASTSAGVGFGASATSPAPESSEPPASEPEEPLAEPEAPAAAANSAEPEAAAPAEPKAAEDEREKTVQLVGLERLPGSAYPAAHVRGIKYGSLWRTFHGEQWPYMPMLENEPGVRIGFSGYVWNDLSNTQISADKSLADSNIHDTTYWTTQSRGLLRVTPTYDTLDDWFVQGNAELVLQGDQNSDPKVGGLPTTDDLFVRVGKWKLFDVTVGRFQGWEIANHYGMALDINTLERGGAWLVTKSIPKPTDGYGLTYFWDRQNFRLGGYAVHFYPTDYLRAEVLTHLGTGNANAGQPYQMDVRPSGVFDIGWLKLKAGYEYGIAKPQDATQKVRDKKNGFGFAGQFVFDPYVEFGGSFARGFEDVIDQYGNADLNSSNTVQTFGGFLNASPGYEPLVFGFGAFWTHYEDFRYDTNVGPHQGKVDTNDQRLLFGTVQYTLWDQLYLKLVVGHAVNKAEDFRAGLPAYTNTALSGRFRAEVLF